MACFTCGASFRPNDRKIIMKLKDEFDRFGVERYVYRLGVNAPLMIVKKKYFNEIYNTKIKPNLSKGSEYMHIKEYTGS